LASYGWTTFNNDGFESDDGFVNVGLEAAHEFGAFRAYAQGGYTFAVDGDASDDNLDAWYGIGKLTYYFNDNFAISGLAGYAQSSSDFVDEDDFAWGATIEAKPWDLPVSVYASYAGDHWEGDDIIGEWDGTEHAFFAGLKFMANSGSIRERDQTVGLKDMNPIFGDLP
jgi:hypothetical protein